MNIQRLGPDHAPAIVDCFRRVYGEAYGNGLFYDAHALAEALAGGALRSVGAVEGDRLLAHMAMITRPGATSAELGNTVVDPEVRGGGLAWKVGDALTDWCVEAGYEAYLHYPTAAHHIMQRQSVKSGFETGVMLGYIPTTSVLRDAATIVCNPLGNMQERSAYLPSAFESLFALLDPESRAPRRWRTSPQPASGASQCATRHDSRRGLTRTTVDRAGADLDSILDGIEDAPCQQLDLSMHDDALDHAVATAQAQGFQFCGWLPGFNQGDVLRLQRVDPALTELTPDLVNPTAAALLEMISGR